MMTLWRGRRSRNRGKGKKMTDDLIRRAAAIDALNDMLADYIPGLIGRDEEIPLKCAVVIRRLPSAQQWIPCDKRLPDPGVNVLVDVADIPAGDRFPLVDMIGEDGEWINCDGSNWLAVAWMPIPGPYNGEAT